jgi:hypothetical protein
VETFSQAMVKIKQSMDALNKNLNSRVESFERDLVEPLDIFHKHYKGQTTEHLKEGTNFWNCLHSDRTQMLFSKENFHN